MQIKKEMKGIFFYISNQPQDIALYFRSNGRMLSMLWIYHKTWWRTIGNNWMFCLQLFCDESIRSWLTVDYLFIIFCRYPTIYTVRQKLSTTWLVAIISFLIMNLFQIGLLFSLPVHTYLPVKQVIDRFLFVWHFFQ